MRAPTEQDIAMWIRTVRARLATTSPGERVTVRCDSVAEWDLLIERLESAEVSRLDVVLTNLAA